MTTTKRDPVLVFNARALKQFVPWTVLFSIRDATGHEIEPRGVAFDGLKLSASLSMFDVEVLEGRFGGEGRLCPSLLKAGVRAAGLSDVYDNERGLVYGWTRLGLYDVHGRNVPVSHAYRVPPASLLAKGQSARKQRIVFHMSKLRGRDALDALAGQDEAEQEAYHVVVTETGGVYQLADLSWGVRAVSLPRETRIQEYGEHPNVNSIHVLLCGGGSSDDNGAEMIADPSGGVGEIVEAVVAPTPALLRSTWALCLAMSTVGGIPAEYPLSTSRRPLMVPAKVGSVAGGKGWYADFHLNPVGSTMKPWWPRLCATLSDIPNKR